MKRWSFIITMTAVLVAASAGCATTQSKSTGSAERAALIAAKLTEAERLGAKACSPRSLARAHVALEHVMHEVAEGYYSAGWLEPEFVAADKLADELVAERRFAASLGQPFVCVSASRPGRGGSSDGEGAAPAPARQKLLRPPPAEDSDKLSPGPRS